MTIIVGQAGVKWDKGKLGQIWVKGDTESKTV